MLEYPKSLANHKVIRKDKLDGYESRKNSKDDIWLNSNGEVWNFIKSKESNIKPKPTDAKGVRGYKGITALFRDKKKKIIHADINGAFNIIQKFTKKTKTNI